MKTVLYRMKFNPSIMALLLAVFLLCGASARAQKTPADKGKDKHKGVPAAKQPEVPEVPEEPEDAEESQDTETVSEAAVAATEDVNVTVFPLTRGRPRGKGAWASSMLSWKCRAARQFI